MAAARRTDGTFQKGHSGNPNGRPKRSTEEKYLTALSRRVTLKDWAKIVDTAVARAKAGDSTARQWLSDYLMGKPVQRSEISGPGGKAIEVDDTRAEYHSRALDTLARALGGLLAERGDGGQGAVDAAEYAAMDGGPESSG